MTLHRASNLPDAPASHVALDELCEPIAAHLAWRHPTTKESLWPKTDDDDDDVAVARVVSWRTASSTPLWRTVKPLESFSAPFMTRDARFDAPTVMFMAKDLPADLHDACASAPLELRVHDRVLRAVPEKFPGLDKLDRGESGEGAEEGAEGAEEADAGEGSFDADGFPAPTRTPERFSTCEARASGRGRRRSFTSRLTWNPSARCPAEDAGRARAALGTD